jgi:hypothetical protein
MFYLCDAIARLSAYILFREKIVKAAKTGSVAIVADPGNFRQNPDQNFQNIWI